ncbi:hypothetical protein [Porphyrobacter sp. HT-58-2]|uniref:hypothetical protein n=1 Tax=Porphyrobacter sp. HT-58-2 TaxID=2023229 RepID=UPI0011AFF1A0|nr:hypothetical protein [Porphyrobacter sp. HT-58-2]
MMVRPRGGPLVVLVMLLTAWGAGRAIWWESPFATLDLPAGLQLAATPGAAPLEALLAGLPALAEKGAGLGAAPDLRGLAGEGAPMRFALVRAPRTGAGEGSVLGSGGMDPRIAAGHRYLLYAAYEAGATPVAGIAGWGDAAGTQPMFAATGQTATQPPFLPGPRSGKPGADRWSLDGWVFGRQGSDAAPVSQGRVPIYGASQAGAVLQYRLAPDAHRDPRLYARAYQALVRRGERELALGASARPLAKVPVRVSAEVRYTDAAFDNIVRPAAFAMTELPVVELPFRTRFEVYGQAGWVGGSGATAFADGQAALTRDVPGLTARDGTGPRLSIGAGAWGGAQEDAQRFDIGPTMRLDLRLGEVPARLSVDWRERVAGDASPGSGLAATLSTRF